MSKKMGKIITISRVFITLFLITIVVSLFLFLLSKRPVRRVFLFQSIDTGKDCIEVRYLSNDSVELFLTELLLGPITDRYKPLFAPETKLISCLTRDNMVYVNLSEQAILQSGISSETEIAVELLNKNLKQNFKRYNNKVFMMGNETYTKLITDNNEKKR